MIKDRLNLQNATTIHQKGIIDINILEKEADMLSFGDGCIVGAGSNLLIKNFKKKFYALSDNFSYIRLENNTLVCGAALRVPTVIRFLTKNGVSSLEFLSGIPASIGGLVYMNAGAFGFSISDRIKYVKIFSKNKGVVLLEKKDIDFSYRKSSLDDCIVLEAGFLYEDALFEDIKNAAANNIKKRIKTAHIKNTFGSVFKNPKGVFAAKLIEECGLKGLSRNTAAISGKHANYIIGTKETDVDDVLYLIDIAKQSVFKNFGIELEEEVKIV